MRHSEIVSTGLAALDDVIQYLRMGDNVVFQVRDIQVYKRFVGAFVKQNKSPQQKIIYFRFSQHHPILAPDPHVEIFPVLAENGFEMFCTQIHDKITQEGRDVFYIFDCLSELLDHWATDSMIGNFFKVTCPYLYELNTIAFFATYKNRNSYQTSAMIRDTTQVLLDVFEFKGATVIHPLKVWNRYTPTLFLPHLEEENEFRPVTTSSEIAILHSYLEEYEGENPARDLDYWDRLFIKAGQLYASSTLSLAEERVHVLQLARIFLTRDEKILELITEHFSLQDILLTKSRLIGSGYLGGKAVGMLLARKILRREHERWHQLLEPHDSFYIGSDVFYSYLMDNELWKLKMELRNATEGPSKKANELRTRILKGQFNDGIRNKILRMLEYFGQAPIIVRSSSLLEDGFGNAFPGKYESIFCINQGTLEERYQQFADAMRRVYASTLSEEALAYRAKHGLTQSEEQMALLIQRVSGSSKQEYFFPDIAGVGYSYNTYVWDTKMNPTAGMIRVVLGLGTRAVDRLEGDYARIASLDHPTLLPYESIQSYKAYSQRKLEVLNIHQNRLQCIPIQELLDKKIYVQQANLAERDLEIEFKLKELGRNPNEHWVFTFNPLFTKTDITQVFSQLLKTLETAYQHPIDIEFTVNFKNDGGYTINLLQCRPLQVYPENARIELLKNPPEHHIVFKSIGHFMGGNIHNAIHKIVFVEPQAYNLLKPSEKYEIARTIGRVNQSIQKETASVLLLGPGRWGSRIPSLGVPVSFSEINRFSILGELGYSKTGYLPDVSFGTHFFQDMVESQMFYLALYPEKEETLFNIDLLENFCELAPLPTDTPHLHEVLKVYAVKSKNLQLFTDVRTQEVKCFYVD